MTEQTDSPKPRASAPSLTAAQRVRAVDLLRGIDAFWTAKHNATRKDHGTDWSPPCSLKMELEAFVKEVSP